VEIDAGWLALPAWQPPAHGRKRLPSGSYLGAHAAVRTAAHTGLLPVRARRFEQLGRDALLAHLDVPEDRLDVVHELGLRADPEGLELVFLALRLLRTEELPAAMAQVVAFGEAASEGLIAAMSAPTAALRQLAALAAARLKLTQAIEPLLEQLDVEPADTGIHPELARALGEFGPAAVRAIARALSGNADSERLVLALAYAAQHGAAKEVERLENDPETTLAQAARKAMARSTRLGWEDLAVREQRSLGEGQHIAQLSQAFYAELLKVAI
jgi:hypothetical protein